MLPILKSINQYNPFVQSAYLNLFMKNTDTTFATKELEDSQNKKEIPQHFNHIKVQQAPESPKRKYQNATQSQNDTKSKLSSDQKQKQIEMLQLPLWNSSATSWTRHGSPQHKVPKSPRFSSLQEDRRRNTQFLQLNLRKSVDKTSQSFAKSQRGEHFINKRKVGFPSPHEYVIGRFLDNSQHKNGKLKLDKIRNQTKVNPEQLRKSTPFMNQSQSSRFSQSRFDQLKGRSFYRARNHSKLYLAHAYNMPYQQHFYKENAEVGQYELRQQIGDDKPKYSLAKILPRFNEKLGNNPGPLEYENNRLFSKDRVSTKKGTFTNSLRIDLAKPLNENPSPNKYAIRRYLELNK